MPLDPEARRTVACAIALMAMSAAGVGCGPSVRPEPPGDEPTPPRVIKRPAPSAGRSALVGEMCPQGVGGRPGLAPLAVRDVSWSSEHDEMESALARGTAAQFAVLASDGRRAGVFSAVGTADVGGATVAVGSFAGSPPCSKPAAAAGGESTADARCLELQRGCGVAVATLGAPGGAFAVTEAPEILVGGACKSGELLAIDIDDDGTAEMFPLGSFVDAVRAPSDEVSAAAILAPACSATFSLFGLVPLAAPGVVMEGKHKVDLDVLAVLDIDGDGRREVVMAYRYTEGRTIAVYSAMSTASRLDLVGESRPWP